MKTRNKVSLALGLVLALGCVMAGRGWALSNPADVELNVTYNGNLSVEVNGEQAATETLVGYTAGNVVVPQLGSNDYAAPVDSITVVNNGGVTERWQLDVSTISGSGNWELNQTSAATHADGVDGVTGAEQCQGSGACPGANQYGLQALFVSSGASAGSYGATGACPSVSSGVWDNYVDTVPVHTNFASITSGGNPVYQANWFSDPNPVNGVDGGKPDFSYGVTGAANDGDMVAYSGPGGPGGQRGLCVRVTMPSSSSSVAQQTIQLEITAENQ